MACINYHQQTALGANAVAHHIEPLAQFIIPEMILALVLHRVKFATCIVRNQCLIITISFVTVIVHNLLAMARKMHIHNIAGLHLFAELAEGFYHALVGGLFIGKHHHVAFTEAL